MTTYVRPPLPREVFLDDAGRPFTYGDRWGDDGPPEDAYSVVTHPERFAALHPVADTLLVHLAATYAGDVAELSPADLTTHTPAAPAHPALAGWGDVERLLRVVVLRPHRAGAAPISIAWTDYPGVEVRAGALVRRSFPSCGCDACDDSVESMADDLEALVLGVAAGRAREWVRSAGPLSCWVGFSTDHDDGEWESGETRHDRRDPQVRAARALLRSLPHGRWQPWTAVGDAAVGGHL
ncbi:DUF6226 family protein [Isoptericola dokdonensis]|uniref:Uncharacterized protein n=1 Tax=Isoptericola dokdonensis DS-3 TaxID=1300344 RepID=A0A168FFE2_9MICO|nr:DUF6226 family protein [Isoptericola dokdonensis]ANC31596.1 hypothetical protein I598_2053 [Isoptericola dokdonensis DS-3]